MIYLMLLISLFAPQGQEKDFLSYEEAHKVHLKSRRPIVIIVTTTTCPYCVTMKKELREFQKDYRNIILCEVSISVAKKQFPNIDTKLGVPQTFMYAYDNEREQTTRFRTILGHKSKADIYKYWGIE